MEFLRRLLVLATAASLCLSTEQAVVEHDIVLSHALDAPDGYTRRVISVNGRAMSDQYEIRGKRGDEVVVNVDNRLPSDGVTLHWHGLEQRGTPYMDGTAYGTQCPVHMTQFQYRFTLDDLPGTYFWHAHHAQLRADGLFGPLIIDPPENSKGLFGDGRTDIPDAVDGEITFLLTDWWHQDSEAQRVGLDSEPFVWIGDPQSVLINGQGTFNCSENFNVPRFCNDTAVKPPVFEVEQGKTYLLRIVNAGQLNWLNFAIQGHKMVLVQADANPIKPVTVDSVDVNTGQRYDVLFTADRDVSNYWISIETRFRNMVKGTGILRYKGASKENPTGRVPDNPRSFDPRLLKSVYDLPDDMKRHDKEINVEGRQKWVDGKLRWPVNGVPYEIPTSGTPLIMHAAFGKLQDLRNQQMAIFVVSPGEVVDIVIQNMPAANLVVEQHSWHLHGYHFYVLGHGPGFFDREKHQEMLNLKDPVLRDTATVFPNGTNFNGPQYKASNVDEPGGWLVVRFRAGNPGAWLMHCHQGPHVEMGMQLVIFDTEGLPLPPKNAPECGLMEQWENELAEKNIAGRRLMRSN